jgi:hypothetical protein
MGLRMIEPWENPRSECTGSDGAFRPIWSASVKLAWDEKFSARATSTKD